MSGRFLWEGVINVGQRWKIFLRQTVKGEVEPILKHACVLWVTSTYEKHKKQGKYTAKLLSSLTLAIQRGSFNFGLSKNANKQTQ